MNAPPSHYQQWRARHRATIESTAPPPGAAELLADDLPINVENTLLYAPAWDIYGPIAHRFVRDPVVRCQMELFDLLDPDGLGLSDLGIWTMRALVRRDADYSARAKTYAARYRKFYEPSFYGNHPRHRSYYTANLLDPDLKEDLLDLAAADGIAGRSDGLTFPSTFAPGMTHLADLGLVELDQIRTSYRQTRPRARLTEFGRTVARIIRLESIATEQIFAGAKCSKSKADDSSASHRAVEIAIARLSRALKHLDQGVAQ